MSGNGNLPKDREVPNVNQHHRYARRRRFRQRLKRGLMLVAVIIAATFVLNFFLDFSKYVPRVYEPKDFEREMLLKKLDDAVKK